MELSVHPAGSLSHAECAEGVRFLRRRFAEEWGLTRLDIDEKSVGRRENLTAREARKLIGWLGIEGNGELTNACVERGFSGNTVLGRLLQTVFRLKPHAPFFVYVPTERLASAVIFLRAGMFLPKQHPPQFKTLTYPERSVHLVRLERCSWPGEARVSSLRMRQELRKLREAIGETTRRSDCPQSLPENC